MLTIWSAFCFQNFQIVAIDFGGQFAFHAADRLLHVVLDGLGEVPDHPGNFFQFAIHGGDQFLLVLVKDGPPLFFGFQADKVLGVEEAGGVGSVIRASHLAGGLHDLGKRGQQHSNLIRQPDALTRPGAGRQGATHPERAFIQMGQEFRSDSAAQHQIGGAAQSHHRHAHHHPAMMNGPAQGPADSVP